MIIHINYPAKEEENPAICDSMMKRVVYVK